jgi:hypothetical protein
LRLLGLMIWRHWVPVAAERRVQRERLASRALALELQRRAAAEFRWTLVQQRAGAGSQETGQDG